MKLRGVKFGDYHTVEDWNLILNSKTITPPKPKTTYVSIAGRDGDLDQSEALAGEIKYENRILNFTFLLTEGTYQDRNDLISRIMTVVHGKRLNIVLDDNTSVYFVGRCTVTESSNNNAYGSISIEANCDPFALKLLDTTKTVTLSTTETAVTLINRGAKTLVPIFTVTGEATIIYGSSSVTIGAGSHRVPNYILKTGTTTLKVKGSGQLTISYKEGYLYV